MDISRGPGWIFSAAAHGALLAGLFVALPDAKKFTDAQETVPVQFITEEQFNQVVKGRKDAKVEKPSPQAVKLADKPEPRVKPPVKEARRDVPKPPPPVKRQPDPGKDDAPKPEQAPKSAQPFAPLPPVRPEQLAKVEPDPKPEPKTRPAPAPKKVVPDVVKEKVEKAEPVIPLPPRRPRNLPRKPVKQPVSKPKRLTTVKPKQDRIAKLLRSKRTDTASKTRVRPKSGKQSNEKNKRFDGNAIARLLSREKAQRRASTGSQVQRQARLGSPTASAAKMSPSMWGQLDGLMQEQYKRCWSFLGLDSGKRYVPQIRLAFTVTGRLAVRPVLLNPPADPALKPLAASAMRAVRKCNPLRIPARFAPFHDEWKARILRFDPKEMLG